jgi:hypothetical protein
MAAFRGFDHAAIKIGELAEKLKSKEPVVRVGFLENAVYPDGTPVAMIAAIQDGGAPGAGIPPRPFFRNMIAAKKGEWPAAIAGLLKDNNYDAVRTLDQTGAAIAGQLRQSITEFNSVPLKPSTIKAKGFDKQLIDTGFMLNSVDFEVKR